MLRTPSWDPEAIITSLLKHLKGKSDCCQLKLITTAISVLFPFVSRACSIKAYVMQLNHYWRHLHMCTIRYENNKEAMKLLVFALWMTNKVL